MLLAHLLRLGGRVRFSAELTGLGTDDAGAHAALADGTSVGARYVVGADGAHSVVRDALGIGLEQLGSLGEFLDVQFCAELGDPRLVLFMIDPSDAREVVLPAGRDRWMYARRLRPGQTPADFDQAGLGAALLRRPPDLLAALTTLLDRAPAWWRRTA